MSPFDYVKTINEKTPKIDDTSEYNPFLTNRAFSYFPDTVLYANEMNLFSHLDKDMQYDYLYNKIRQKKRFSKWYKPERDENISFIMTNYKYSLQKARQVVLALTEEQMEELKRRLDKGGSK